jgi:small neutral amino acid transporter SnatA (MarC family)
MKGIEYTSGHFTLGMYKNHTLWHLLLSLSDELAIVTLWGEQAEKFDAEDIQQISLQENVFMLFVGMNVTLFKGTSVLQILSDGFTCLIL